MKLKIYSPRFIKNSKTIQYSIKLETKYPFEVYKNYKYISDYLTTKKDDCLINNFSIEHLPRFRRTVDFINITNLIPLKQINIFNEIDELSRHYYQLDHVTYWINKNGTQFILNEPYCEIDKFLYIENPKLLYIDLPVNLSPYCGFWSSKQHVKPHTTSFLITKAEHSNELFEIQKNLELATIGQLGNFRKPIPSWNSLEGITVE